MRSLIYQFYNEGFATTFLLKPINYLSNNIKNKKLINYSTFIIKFLYTILMIFVLALVIYFKYFYKK